MKTNLLKQFFLFVSAFILLGTATANAQESIMVPEKAILEVSQADGIRISDKAIKTLEIVTNSLSPGSESFSIPPSAIIHSLDKVGVYRLRNGWFKFIEVKMLERSSKRTTVYSSELHSSDQVVIQGVALLRVTEMDAFGGEND